MSNHKHLSTISSASLIAIVQRLWVIRSIALLAACLLGTSTFITSEFLTTWFKSIWSTVTLLSKTWPAWNVQTMSIIWILTNLHRNSFTNELSVQKLSHPVSLRESIKTCTDAHDSNVSPGSVLSMASRTLPFGRKRTISDLGTMLTVVVLQNYQGKTVVTHMSNALTWT